MTTIESGATSAQEVVTVRWECRNTHWGKGAFGVADHRACGHESVGETTRAEYEAKAARARCPSCGGLLTQVADGCEVVT